MHQICVRSLVALRRIVYKIYKQYPCLAGRRSLPLGLIVNADSMLVRNPASLGIENQRTKCVKMFRSNCIDFSPTTTMYYAYSTIKAPDKGEVGGSSPPRPTIQITSKYAAILTFPLFVRISLKKPFCQPFVNFTIGRMAIHSGALRPSGEGRTARIDLAMSRMPPSKVEGRARQARHCKIAERAGRHF